MVGWLPREAVPILCEHHEDPAGDYQVSYPVHARTFQARSALPGVGYFFEDLVALSRSVVSEGF